LPNPLKILILTWQGDFNGATYSTFYLADGLANKGHQVWIGCPQKSILANLLPNSRAKHIPINFKSKLDLKSIKQIADLVKEHQIQIINAQASKDRYAAIFAKWFYSLNCKVIHTRRQKPMSSLGWLQTQFYVKGTDKVVCISEQLKQTFVKKGYPEKHIYVIYNGIPKSFFREIDFQKVERLKQELKLKSNQKVIGCFARKKQQHQLIQALNKITQPTTLLLAGIEKEYFNQLQKLNKNKHQLICLGKIPREELAEYYALLNCFVLPSNMDGFGLVLVEAMGFGIPVIATKAFGIIDVLDNQQNGLWFDNENPQQLVTQINKLFNDKILEKKLIENGKKAAFNRFTLQNTINNYEEFFINLIS